MLHQTGVQNLPPRILYAIIIILCIGGIVKDQSKLKDKASAKERAGSVGKYVLSQLNTVV